MGEAVRAIIMKGNTYLLVQRGGLQTKSYGQWQFPGGKREKLKKAQALKKEILEETGLTVKSIHPFKKVNIHFEDTGNHSTVFYKVKAEGDVQIQESEISNFGWYDKKESLELDLTPSTKHIFNDLR